MWESLKFALSVVGMLAAFLALRYLYILYQREKKAASVRNPQQDLANMMILFQTMRDLLRQQKELVRQLNENIDQKIALIRKMVHAALDNHEKLVRAQRDLSAAMEDAKADLTSIQRQLSYASEGPEAGHAKSPGRSTRAGRISIPDIERGNVHNAEELRKLATDFSDLPEPEPLAPASSTARDISGIPKGRPRPAGARGAASNDDALVDGWVGMDFGGADTVADEFEAAPSIPPETPEDPESAREAFRALLNMEGNRTARPPATRGEPGATVRGGNGQGRIPPLHARVYEYNDAGMTVAQIARELGVGKGEIRLILSLRPDKEQ